MHDIYLDVYCSRALVVPW